MTISSITDLDIARFCRICIDESDFPAPGTPEAVEVAAIRSAAIDFVCGYTGLKATDNVAESLRYAVLCVAAEMFENRQMSAQSDVQNKTAVQIMAMHSTNLLPTVEEDDDGSA